MSYARLTDEVFEALKGRNKILEERREVFLALDPQHLLAPGRYIKALPQRRLFPNKKTA